MTPHRCPLSVPECDEACGQCPSLGEVAESVMGEAAGDFWRDER